MFDKINLGLGTVLLGLAIYTRDWHLAAAWFCCCVAEVRLIWSNN